MVDHSPEMLGMESRDMQDLGKQVRKKISISFRSSVNYWPRGYIHRFLSGATS